MRAGAARDNVVIEAGAGARGRSRAAAVRSHAQENVIGTAVVELGDRGAWGGAACERVVSGDGAGDTRVHRYLVQGRICGAAAGGKGAEIEITVRGSSMLIVEC